MEKIKDLTEELNGDKATLYKLDRSIIFGEYESRYVVVSTSSRYGLETYAFISDDNGNFKTSKELHESQKGRVDHDEMARRVEQK